MKDNYADSEKQIYLSLPDITEAEKQALLAAFDSGYVAPLGPQVDEFEARMAEYVGRSHAVALSSGTAALHLGLLNYGIGPGDLVLVPTLTFAATANAVVYTGATPVFVDCGKDTNVDPLLLGQALATLASEGTPAKAIMPVDMLGKVCEPGPLLELAEEYDIPIVWDAAESVGSSRAGKMAGAFGECAAFSFNGNKSMTTSGGGMLLTDDEEVAERTKYLSTQARQPVAHYEHTEIGYNYRMSNLLAAVGIAQLKRLESMKKRRQMIRRRYQDFVAQIPGVEIVGGQWQYPDGEDNCWLTAITVDSKVTGWEAAELGQYMGSRRIETRPIWKPMHQQPVFASHRAFLNGNSDWLFETGLDLPSGSQMSEDDLERIFTALTQFTERHGK
ncbi:MAG: aminotransferase class I/II-fold pyridoxal phosphate-dependent enzyme [Actinomycetaceae bacterium]|nr:aminotransferase class I/II-fold pyridoxal phosphate-dependent enzyme [Actinomycetaceae bacterium]